MGKSIKCVWEASLGFVKVFESPKEMLGHCCKSKTKFCQL